MVLLVATREVRYAAKQYLRGQTFEASDKDARLLKAIKKAKEAPEPAPAPAARRPVLPTATAPTPPREPVAVKEEPIAEKPVEAAPSPVEAAAEAKEPVAQTPTSTTTRYRRRDLQPQE